MFCDEALDAVEAIAAGEVMPDGRHNLYAYGLRNPVGMAFRPGTEPKVAADRTFIIDDAAPAMQ